jgi:hypothetical protein
MPPETPAAVSTETTMNIYQTVTDRILKQLAPGSSRGKDLDHRTPKSLTSEGIPRRQHPDPGDGAILPRYWVTFREAQRPGDTSAAVSASPVVF